MSVNNIYMIVTTPPFKRYKKTLPSKLSGFRFNADGDRTVSFVLDNHPSGREDYEFDVLEIYSDREDRFLRQMNKSFFQLGLLKETNDNPVDLSTINMLTDDQVRAIAATKNITVLRKNLNELTSEVAVRRILEVAREIGRPKKTLDMIEHRAEALVNA